MSIDEATFAQFEAQVKQLKNFAPPVTLSDAQKVQRAKRVMLERLDSRTAMDLETCVHCGMCAEACHFYESTHDPKYTPIHKAYLLRKVYRRELSPMRFLNKLFLRELTAQELEEWQELVFNSCTECGRCDMMCPMGIHISKAIAISREALSEAGCAPAELRAVEYEQSERGTLFGIGPAQLTAAVEALRAQGIEVPLDKPKAEVMVVTTAVDLVLFKDTFTATAKILNAAKADWTLQSAGFEGANFGMLSGHRKGQAKESKRIVDAAIACGAKVVITPECGHAYPALRWEAANTVGKPLPFDVFAISEYIGREIRAGRLRVKPVAVPKSVTYHDPCKIGRHGGVFEEPRIALKALGVDLKEMPSHGTTQYCCGGGAGVFLIDAAEPLRRRAFEIKQRQADDTGADSVVTTCDSCRINFMSGARKVNWDKPVESLVELVAANLAD